jgi:hypothetical protein
MILGFGGVNGFIVGLDTDFELPIGEVGLALFGAYPPFS